MQPLGALLLAQAAFGVAQSPYSEYILAPESRTLRPVSVHQANGSVTGAESLTDDGSTGPAVFEDESAVAYDFGKNIAGVVTLQMGDVDEDQYIGVTFSESSLWVSSEGCDATADAGIDEPLWFQPSGPGKLEAPRQRERGAFRYMTLVHNTTGRAEVNDVTIHYTPMPHVEEDALRDYSGYFHCDDELLNRIWYAGAYTNQICTIDPNYGDSLVFLGVLEDASDLEEGQTTVPWWSNTTISNGTSVITDGAKRDRLVWPGDMAIAVPTIAVSYYDMISITNALDSLFNLQNATNGQLPYAGVGFRQSFSATYHLYSLIGVADHYLYTAELDYVREKWDQWKFGLDYSLSTIDDSGLMNVTSSNDWLRFGMGGHNIEANAILYHTINLGLQIATLLGEPASTTETWTQYATGIKSAANALLWNESAGLYNDNETTTLAPQDGNCWAIISNLTDSTEKNTAISAALRDRWTPYGAPALEADDAISPFISSFELQAHFLAGDPSAAVDLMHLQWGFMLDDPRMTNSTFIEGYASNGDLQYAPYSNDPRVSHAHGWATGPTSILSEYIAGIHILAAGGEEWEMRPSLGELRHVDAGFETSVGSFAATIEGDGEGGVTAMRFQTPVGTRGRVDVPGLSGTLRSGNGTAVPLVDGMATGLVGGSWTLEVQGGNGTGYGNGTATGVPPMQTENAGAVVGASVVGMLGVVAGGLALVL